MGNGNITSSGAARKPGQDSTADQGARAETTGDTAGQDSAPSVAVGPAAAQPKPAESITPSGAASVASVPPKAADPLPTPAAVEARDRAMARTRSMQEALSAPARRGDAPEANPEAKDAQALAMGQNQAGANSVVQSQVLGGAINAHGQPEFTRTDIRIITADLDKTLQELEPWLTQQQVQVLELDRGGAGSGKEQDAARPLGREKRIVLLLRASQVARLEVHLSGQPNQISRLSPANAESAERRAGLTGLKPAEKKSQALPDQSGDESQADMPASATDATTAPAPASAPPAVQSPGARPDPLVLLPVVIEEIKP